MISKQICKQSVIGGYNSGRRGKYVVVVSDLLLDIVQTHDVDFYFSSCESYKYCIFMNMPKTCNI